MAVDTANKRYSMIGLGAPVPSLLPVPDGSITGVDKLHLIYLYSGISAQVVAVRLSKMVNARFRGSATVEI